MKIIILTIGSSMIGVLTSLCGFPIYDTSWHLNNLFILLTLSSLWVILVELYPDR